MTSKTGRVEVRLSPSDYIAIKNARLNISHICRMALRKAALDSNNGNGHEQFNDKIFKKKDAFGIWHEIKDFIIPILSYQEIIQIYSSSYPIRELHNKMIHKITLKYQDKFETFIKGDETSEEVLLIFLKEIIEDRKNEPQVLRGVEKCA